MLKKVSLLMLGIVALSQSALAAKSAADVLASCANATDKTPAFQVLGDLRKFYGLRVGPQVANVAVQDLSGQGFFPGQVTLTKSAPYQYVLYGYYVGKTTAERPVAPAIPF